MKVRVLKKWGNYKKGDELEMHPTTAKGVAAHGYIQSVDGSLEEQKAKETAKDMLKASFTPKTVRKTKTVRKKGK